MQKSFNPASPAPRQPAALTAPLTTVFVASLALAATCANAFALSKEQAIANCRESVGRPIVMACMQRAGGGEANFARCRETAVPKVKACVVAALNAANGRANVPLEMYKNGKPTEEAVAPGNALPAGFVPPPRTIGDIAAILDNEKPDPAVLAKLKADADNEPAKGISQSDLAQFYYDRGNARASVGRNVEGLADGEKALSIATASGDGFFGQRIRQFITIQKLSLGDVKGALGVSQFMVTDANRPGQKGYTFNARRIAAQVLVQMGDIPQAEGYMRASQAMIQEARTSGLPGWREGYAKAPAWARASRSIKSFQSVVRHGHPSLCTSRSPDRQRPYAPQTDYQMTPISCV